MVFVVMFGGFNIVVVWNEVVRQHNRKGGKKYYEYGKAFKHLGEDK